MSTVHLGDLDMNLLLALTTLLEEKHVTRAAARLGITQSAMSHALSRLRVVLDDPLFVRTPRGVVPTPRAQQLAEPLKSGLAQISEALAAGRTFDPSTATRVFRIAATDYGELAFLPALTARLVADAPGIDVVVKMMPADVPQALESGAVDLAIGFGSEDWPSIYRQQLFADRFVCVVRDGHPTVKKKLDLEQYVALTHVLVSPTGIGKAYVDEVLARRDLTRRVAVSVPHFLIAPLVVASTDLVLTVPERVAEILRRGLQLKIVECPLELQNVRINQMWHERVHGDPAHAWLRQMLVKAVALPRDKATRG